MNTQSNPEQIFHEARQLPAGRERNAFLRGACAQDADLRAKVDALLAADDDAGRFLAEPDNHSEECSGRFIGRYKLLQRIGEGGFGTVWMAEQKEPVRRRVALKIIKLGMDTRQVIARFEAERQALAMMDHPSIARVLDAGASDSGRPYFVMELVNGVPIVEYCDKEKLDTQARLALFAKVCHAIQHAHQKGIIHRDIKPSNVLVTMHDGVPVPKVIDFGIAKATNQELTEKTLFTEFRQLVGTPAYMSPEQAEMSGLDIDTRSDIYSLGVLLYELLTGTTPFDVRSLIEAGYAEMLRAIREDEPHKPSTRVSTLGDTGAETAERRHTDVRKLGSTLRGDLDWIIMKCLEKDRRRRYETASGLAHDIARHLDHEPVLAGPPSTSYRLSKLVRRNRGQVVAVSALAIALVAGIIGTSFGMIWARREQARVVAQNERASAALRQVQDEFVAQFEPLPEAADGGEPISIPIVAAPLEGEEPSGGEVEALARTAVNLVRSLEDARQQTARELQLANESKELMQQMFASVDPREARTADTGLLRRILEDASERLGSGAVSDDRVQAELRSTLGRTYYSLGELDSAESLLTAALEGYRRSLGPDHPDTLGALHDLGLVVWKKGDFETAEALFREALAGQRAVLGAEHSATLSSLNNMGIILQELGAFEEAEAVYSEVLETLRRNEGEDHPDTLNAMSNLGTVLFSRGEMEQAAVLFRAALEGRQQILGEDHPDTLYSLHTYGVWLLERGELEPAEELLTTALERAREVLGPDHTFTLTSSNALSLVYSRQGRFEEALALLELTLEGRQRVLGRDHPATLSSLYNLGELLQELGRMDEAEACLQAAYEGALQSFGAEHPDTATWASGLAELWGQLQRREEARALARAAVAQFEAHPEWSPLAANEARRVLLQLEAGSPR